MNNPQSTIDSLPTFAKWTEATELKNDNMISAYIADLKDILPDLMVMASDNQPWRNEEPSFTYKTICHASRVIGLLVRDLKAIRSEVDAQRATA
ncbi:MAG: hypothetical protein IJP44_06785 [Bacteroidales bacterium]|nr:hypothetical protein [Bacteroidales bacterium]